MISSEQWQCTVNQSYALICSSSTCVDFDHNPTFRYHNISMYMYEVSITFLTLLIHTVLFICTRTALPLSLTIARFQEGSHSQAIGQAEAFHQARPGGKATALPPANQIGGNCQLCRRLPWPWPWLPSWNPAIIFVGCFN